MNSLKRSLPELLSLEPGAVGVPLAVPPQREKALASLQNSPMVAYPHRAILDQYTVAPRLDGGSFDFERAHDANGNLTLVMEYPRTADMDGNYIVDAGDLQAFQTAYMGEDPAADLNGDEVFDQADLTLFTTAFTNAPAGGFYHAALKYDERNQLIGFEARRGGTLLTKASFRYDAFNRRVASFADTDGDASDDVVTYSVYGGQAAWQLLGEYDGADDTANPLRSFVYGLYIDEVLSMRDHASEEDFFYHQDDLFSVYALTDGDGAVVERYDYGDYGQVSIMEANGTPRAESQYDNRHAFTGRLLVPGLTLDDGSQILEYRHRSMHTATGSFIQRDAAGYVDSPNFYTYVANNPGRYVDYYGFYAVSIAYTDTISSTADPSEDLSLPENDPTSGCGITRKTRHPATISPVDPGHSWLDVPDPGRYPNDYQHPEHRRPGSKPLSRFPDGWRTPHGPGNRPTPNLEPAVSPSISRPTTTRPRPVEVIPEDYFPPITVIIPNSPLRYGPGAGTPAEQATCEQIRRCLFECQITSTYLFIINNCHTGSRHCLRRCGLRIDR
jgi:RHS repeat-associated protein